MSSIQLLRLFQASGFISEIPGPVNEHDFVHVISSICILINSLLVAY